MSCGYCLTEQLPVEVEEVSRCCNRVRESNAGGVIRSTQISSSDFCLFPMCLSVYPVTTKSQIIGECGLFRKKYFTHMHFIMAVSILWQRKKVNKVISKQPVEIFTGVMSHGHDSVSSVIHKCST